MLSLLVDEGLRDVARDGVELLADVDDLGGGLDLGPHPGDGGGQAVFRVEVVAGGLERGESVEADRESASPTCEGGHRGDHALGIEGALVGEDVSNGRRMQAKGNHRCSECSGGKGRLNVDLGVRKAQCGFRSCPEAREGRMWIWELGRLNADSGVARKARMRLLREDSQERSGSKGRLRIVGACEGWAPSSGGEDAEVS